MTTTAMTGIYAINKRALKALLLHIILLQGFEMLKQLLSMSVHGLI